MRNYLIYTSSVLLSSGLCFGSLTVYEGFDYSGTDFYGENGGIGWEVNPGSDGWRETGEISGNVTVYQNSSLDNDAFDFTPVGGVAVTRDGTSNATRKLATSIDLGADSGPIFFSYLLSAEDAAGTENQLSFYDDTTSVLDTGIRLDDFRLRSGSSAQLKTGDPVDNTTYFIAGFIDPNSATNDVFGYNVYTTTGSIVASVDTTDAGDWFLYDDEKSLSSVIDRVLLVANGGTDSHQARFDEFRMGTTWDSVTQIPEPQAFACVGGLVALGMITARRRHQR